MLILFLSLLLCTGCSPQRRLNRLLQRHPGLTFADTLKCTDTLEVPGVQVDTSVPMKQFPDTVSINKGRLEILVKKVHDTLFIRGKCKPDTVVIRRNIPVKRIQQVRQSANTELFSRIPWLVTGLIALIVLTITLILKFKQ